MVDKNKYKDGDIKVIDGKEYKFITLKGRSKWVSKDGDLINPFRNQEAKTHIGHDGYLCAGGSVPVHKYVAHAWVNGYFEGAEVNHKDFNRLNPSADNLEWVTHLENIKYTLENNYEVVCKSRQGEHNGRAKFTENDILKIRELYDNGKSIADIIRYFYPNMIHARDYKNIHSNITNIAKRKTWTYLP